jgi:hypothetical protein
MGIALLLGTKDAVSHYTKSYNDQSDDLFLCSEEWGVSSMNVVIQNLSHICA